MRAMRTTGALVRSCAESSRGGLVLHYQPQFDLRTLAPCGLEALARWRTGDRLLAPGEFIPLACRRGLMQELTRRVLDTACRDNASLIEAGLLDVPVAVNVSALSIATDDFLSLVSHGLRAGPLPPDRLELELTEDAAMDVSLQTLRNATRVSRMGIGLAMDDYGKGSSSLTHLRDLPFDKLKLDRSFISALPDSCVNRAIVQSTVSLGHELGLPIVAEGIETEAQARLLRSMGCDIGQGYWYAAPMPLSRLVEWLAGGRVPRTMPAACD